MLIYLVVSSTKDIGDTRFFFFHFGPENMEAKLTLHSIKIVIQKSLYKI